MESPHFSPPTRQDPFFFLPCATRPFPLPRTAEDCGILPPLLGERSHLFSFPGDSHTSFFCQRDCFSVPFFSFPSGSVLLPPLRLLRMVCYDSKRSPSPLPFRNYHFIFFLLSVALEVFALSQSVLLLFFLHFSSPSPDFSVTCPGQHF